MIDWLSSNIATIVTALVVAAMVLGAALSVIRDRKKGKSSCGCNCGCCPMSTACHAARAQGANK